VKGNVLEIFESFQGEGPYVGAPQIFVRTGGCHLRCAYCDTPESWTTEGSAAWEADALAAELERRAAARRFHSISITGGEPLLQAEFLADVLSRRKPLPVHLDTSGTLPERLARLIDLVDVVAMDIKLPSCPGTRADWDETERTLAVAARKEAFVKIVLTRDTTEEEIARAGGIIRRVDPSIRLFLQPATPFGGQEPPPPERVARFRAAAGDLCVFVVPQIHVLMGWK
jgi:organic radical activating enzyme